MKKKILLFLVIFSISIIITYPAFPPSHALDSYCTMCNGYSKTGIWFLENGRIFSYLLFVLIDTIKLSYNALGFVSVLLGNAVMSLTILAVYSEFEKKIKFTNCLYNYLLLGLIFLVYYNPLYTGVLVFDELVIIDLGILFVSLSAIFLLKGGIKNYLISLLLTIFGITCYQGIASYLFVILFLFIVVDKDRFNNIKYYFIKFTLAVFNYGISFFINLLIIKLINSLFNGSIVKVGAFNVISNINKLVLDLIPKSFRYLFNYVNVKYYYLLVIISGVLFVIFLVKNNNKLSNLIVLLLLLLSCVFVPFIPNIFMITSSNYIDAGMALTLGIIPVVFTLYVLISYKVDVKYFYILSCIGILIFGLTFYSIRQNMLIDLKRYKNDVKYINGIISDISNYEEKNGYEINTIYYHYDNDSAYYYGFGYPNGVNVRIMAVPWGFDCAFNAISNNKFAFKKMSDKKYDELFKDKEYDEFDDEQLVYDKDKLYLLIF